MTASVQRSGWPFKSLAAVLLTWNYSLGVTGRLDESPMYKDRYADPVYAECAGRIVDHAREQGWPPAALAVAWVMAHPAVTSAIIGARNLEQLDETLGCQDISLAPVQRAELSALSIEPPPATDRTEER